MLAYVGPKPQGHEVDHIDSNTLNNDLTNLQYLSQYENMKKRRKKA